MYIDEEGGLQRNVGDEYTYRAHSDIGISLAIGDSATAYATAIAKLQVAMATAIAKGEAMLYAMPEANSECDMEGRSMDNRRN